VEFKLPDKALVNKFIAKNKFYERVQISTKLQNEFIKKIQRITWKYKLAEETIGISKTENVTEIQIFEIELKEKEIPKNVLKIIDKTIPYQILYVFIYEENLSFGITLKKDNVTRNYYFSDWNEELDFDFTGIDLYKIYQNLIKAFISLENKEERDFNSIVEIDKRIKILQNEIDSLQNKIKRERQFNRKVDQNKMLLEKKTELIKLLEK